MISMLISFFFGFFSDLLILTLYFAKKFKTKLIFENKKIISGILLVFLLLNVSLFNLYIFINTKEPFNYFITFISTMVYLFLIMTNGHKKRIYITLKYFLIYLFCVIIIDFIFIKMLLFIGIIPFGDFWNLLGLIPKITSFILLYILEVDKYVTNFIQKIISYNKFNKFYSFRFVNDKVAFCSNKLVRIFNRNRNGSINNHNSIRLIKFFIELLLAIVLCFIAFYFKSFIALLLAWTGLTLVRNIVKIFFKRFRNGHVPNFLSCMIFTSILSIIIIITNVFYHNLLFSFLLGVFTGFVMIFIPKEYYSEDTFDFGLFYSSKKHKEVAIIVHNYFFDINKNTNVAKILDVYKLHNKNTYLFLQDVFKHQLDVSLMLDKYNIEYRTYYARLDKILSNLETMACPQ